jgi:large subunit ribosomal protein L35
MPKMKTKRGAAKRFRASGSGRVRRNQAYTSHILTKKNSKRKRNLRKGSMVAESDVRSVRRMLPYL